MNKEISIRDNKDYGDEIFHLQIQYNNPFEVIFYSFHKVFNKSNFELLFHYKTRGSSPFELSAMKLKMFFMYICNFDSLNDNEKNDFIFCLQKNKDETFEFLTKFFDYTKMDEYPSIKKQMKDYHDNFEKLVTYLDSATGYIDLDGDSKINIKSQEKYNDFILKSIKTFDSYGLAFSLLYVLNRTHSFLGDEIIVFVEKLRTLLQNMLNPDVFERYNIEESLIEYKKIMKLLHKSSTNIIFKKEKTPDDNKISLKRNPLLNRKGGKPKKYKTRKNKKVRRIRS